MADAWVAFGSKGRRYARELAQQLKDEKLSRKLLRYGALNRPSESSQATLLLKIGNLVVVDWSHNGKVRIWRESDINIPEFGEPQYHASHLRLSCAFERPHLPPTGWQAPVHDFIRRHTRITIPAREYMP